MEELKEKLKLVNDGNVLLSDTEHLNEKLEHETLHGKYHNTWKRLPYSFPVAPVEGTISKRHYYYAH